MNILVVDDSAALRLLLKAKLRSWGHVVELASDGLEGWEMARDNAFDLIISDWDMPRLDGIELCRKIRQHAFDHYVYVILCTGKDQREDKIVGMDAGADDFITKPVDFAELRVRLTAGQRVMHLQQELASQNQSLRELNSELTNAYRTMQRDVEAAAATQIRLLPRVYDLHPRVCLDWLFLPSRFLAGDMLNYFMAGTDKLVFYHLDVSGHGIPSALLSVTLSKTIAPIPGSPSIRTGSTPGRLEVVSPAQVVSELNARFQGEDDTYFTIFYGVLDVHSRELTYCQAGHPGPVLLRRGAPPLSMGGAGFPVGMMPEMEYEEETICLETGDRLILLSDGVSECENEASGRYGEERLLEMLSQKQNESLPSLMKQIRGSVENWRGATEFSDDVSVLGLECT